MASNPLAPLILCFFTILLALSLDNPIQSGAPQRAPLEGKTVAKRTAELSLKTTPSLCIASFGGGLTSPSTVLLLVFAGLLLLSEWRRRQQLQHERAALARLQKMESLREEFLVQTSRELVTPLNGIIGLAESARDKKPEERDRGKVDDLDLILYSGRKLVDLVERIKVLGKLQDHELELKQGKVDLVALVETVFSECRFLADKKRLTLVNEVPSDLPLFFSDERHIRQILYKLIDNAIRFSDQGTISVAATTDDEHLTVQVADTGKGLETESLERIHRFLEKTNGEMGSLYEGVGLGLVLTRQLAILLGGTLSVATRSGPGSIFRLALPLKAGFHKDVPCGESPPPAYPKAGTDPALLSRECSPVSPPDPNASHILVVDDESVNRRVLARQLSQPGYRVSLVKSGVEALAMLERGDRVDLILMDVMMPEMSGYEACAKIRERFNNHELPIIFLTAKNQIDDLVDGFDHGGNDFLTKPVPKAELLIRVHSQLRLVEHHRQLEKLVEERTRTIQSKNTELQTFNEIVNSINRELDLPSLFTALVEQGLRLFPQAEEGAFIHFEESSGFFRFVAAVGPNMAKLHHVSLGYDQACERYRQHGRRLDKGVYVLGDGKQLPHGEAFHGQKMARSILAMTVTLEDRIQGFLILCNFHLPEAFEDSDLDQLIRYREHAVSAVARAKSMEVQNKQHEDLVRTHQHMVMQEKMASLGILTAGVAHEINNPTNFADVSTHLMADDLVKFREFLVELAGEDADEEVLEAISERFQILTGHLDTIQEGTRRIKQIVRDLGAFSRQDENESYVNIADCLTSTVNLVRTKYQEVATVDCEYHADPRLACHPAQLNQVFMNLIVNACQAIDHGIENEGHGVRGKLLITTDIEKDDLVIRFRDNGCGMSDEVKAKIFEPFYTTKPEGEGTGLGLSISYRIIQQHGGTINVESVIGEGTTFTILLPVKTGTRQEV